MALWYTGAEMTATVSCRVKEAARDLFLHVEPQQLQWVCLAVCSYLAGGGNLYWALRWEQNSAAAELAFPAPLLDLNCPCLTPPPAQFHPFPTTLPLPRNGSPEMHCLAVPGCPLTVQS